jgi:GntR family transcriptional regulator, rspAB operon transcriptional repressor
MATRDAQETDCRAKPGDERMKRGGGANDAAVARTARGANESAARHIFEELKRAIVTMALRPGQALSENDIATRMGVSRQPVREAFIKLSEVGLVRVRPQRGTFVVKISTKQVTDARFVRVAVEVAVVRRACEAMSTSAIAELREILARQKIVAAEGEPGSFLALDEAFHRGLALGADCDYAWLIVEKVKAQMDRVRYLSTPDATPYGRLVEQHVAILDAVEAHEPARAEAAVREHLSEILTSLPLLERIHPDLFESGE